MRNGLDKLSDVNFIATNKCLVCVGRNEKVIETVSCYLGTSTSAQIIKVSRLCGLIHRIYK